MRQKPLFVIREELRVLVAEKAKTENLVLPSARDEAFEALNFMAGRVLSGGGAEAMLRLVEQAMESGRDW